MTRLAISIFLLLSLFVPAVLAQTVQQVQTPVKKEDKREVVKQVVKVQVPVRFTDITASAGITSTLNALRKPAASNAWFHHIAPSISAFCTSGGAPASTQY